MAGLPSGHKCNPNGTTPFVKQKNMPIGQSQIFPTSALQTTGCGCHADTGAGICCNKKNKKYKQNNTTTKQMSSLTWKLVRSYSDPKIPYSTPRLSCCHKHMLMPFALCLSLSLFFSVSLSLSLSPSLSLNL